MSDEYWKNRYNPLRFFLKFLMIMLVVNWFHEFGHLTALKILGGDGYVVTGFLVFATNVVEETTHAWGMVLMAYAGGLCSMLFCFSAYVLERETSWEDKVVWFSVGMTQLFYGAVEGTLFMLDLYKYVPLLGSAAMILAALISFAMCKVMWTAEELNLDPPLVM